MQTKNEVKIMLKKVFGMLGAMAFLFSATAKTDFVKNLASTCYYVCLDHDGDLLTQLKTKFILKKHKKDT